MSAFDAASTVLGIFAGLVLGPAGFVLLVELFKGTAR